MLLLHKSLATIVIYYEGSNSEIEHKGMVVILDNLIHDSEAINSIQEIIINYIKKSFDFVEEVMLFTDGAIQHFKNLHNIQNFSSSL